MSASDSNPFGFTKRPCSDCEKLELKVNNLLSIYQQQLTNAGLQQQTSSMQMINLQEQMNKVQEGMKQLREGYEILRASSLGVRELRDYPLAC